MHDSKTMNARVVFGQPSQAFAYANAVVQRQMNTVASSAATKSSTGSAQAAYSQPKSK